MVKKETDTGEPQGIDKARAEYDKPKDEDKGKTDPPKDEDKDDDEGGDEDDDGDDDKDATINRLKKALKKSNADAKRNRLRAKRRGADDEEDEEEDDEKPAKKKGGDSDTVPRRELHERDAADLLRDSGLRGKDGRATTKEARRLVKLLDSVEPDEVEDSIAELMEDSPHLFVDEEEEKPKRKRSPRVGPAGAERRRSNKSNSNLSATSEAMLRMGGFQ